MKKLDGMQARICGIGRSALVGTLVGMMAAQGFAAAGPVVPSERSTQSETRAVPSAVASVGESSTSAELNALPQAPEPAETASLNKPAAFDPMISEAAQDGQSLRSTQSSEPHKGVQRPGMLIVGIVGAAAMVMGGYIYSIKTTATGSKMALGTMFMAPGAAAAGLGFYFAFKPKK